MKRITAILLAICLTTIGLLLSACQTASQPPSGEIIYGSSTQMSNVFSLDFNGGNNAVNYDIARLTSGLGTYEWSVDEVYVQNKSVVKKVDSKVNDDGSKTYTFEIYDDLLFSDGTPVNAKHYVFSALLGSCPEYGEIEAYNFGGDELVGFDEFNSGATKSFKGVRLLGDYSFSITISKDSLPYYYDQTLAAYGPSPIHVIAPNADIADSEDGASITGDFSADVLRQTMLDPTSGQVYNPTVFTGPYMLESYDSSNHAAVLVINPNYKGAYDKNKPSIAKIIIKYTPSETRMDMLANGEVQLMPGINGGKDIGAGLDLCEDPSKNLSYASYPRAGYGKITLRCDFGPTRFVAVRQAIAFCLDRDEFCKQYTGGYGIVVDGYYGASMREYRENQKELSDKLIHYSKDLDKAKQLLIDDGWTLNSTGGAYVEGSNEPRYKDVDGTLEPLIVKWFGTEGNPVADLISTMLVPETIKIGLKIEPTMGDFPTLQANMQKSGEAGAEFHMFNLATGFGTVAATWYYYGTDPAYMGQYNSNFISDTQLETLALDMKKTEPGDFKSWSSKWVQFQIRWNELMPDIPLYSDEYHDFYPSTLTNYNPSPMWGWAYAIQRARWK